MEHIMKLVAIIKMWFYRFYCVYIHKFIQKTADHNTIPRNNTSKTQLDWRKLPLSRRVFFHAYIALQLERLLPRLLPFYGVVGVFIALSWLDFFYYLPRNIHVFVFMLFVFAGLIAIIFAFYGTSFASRAAVEARIDSSKPDFHHPLQSLHDHHVATPSGMVETSVLTRQLWQKHHENLLTKIPFLFSPPLSLQLEKYDPFALRHALFLILIAAAFIAGEMRMPRLQYALAASPFARVAGVPPRLDLWLDPPAYTGKAPIFFNKEAIQPQKTTKQPTNKAEASIIAAPSGSILTIRLAGGAGEIIEDVELIHDKGLTHMIAPPSPSSSPQTAAPPSGIAVFQRVLQKDSPFTLRYRGQVLAHFQLQATPDLAPKVVLKPIAMEDVEKNPRAKIGVILRYNMEDDYGIAKAELLVERTPPLKKGERALFPPPQAKIPLNLGEGSIKIDTQDHPWAGEEVNFSLRIEDDIGQRTTSEVQTIRLPHRAFAGALPRALVEQRRMVNFQPDDLTQVKFVFYGFLIEPQRFFPKIGEFIGMDRLKNRLQTAQSEAELKAVSEDIYAFASYLEYGDATLAERRFREAEARLREALIHQAAPEEIARLTQALNEAARELMRERAGKEDYRASPRENQQEGQEKTLSMKDLSEHLRKIEELTKSGQYAEADRLLQEYQKMIENLRFRDSPQAKSPTQDLREQLKNLDRLQRDQQQLRDKTFQESQKLPFDPSQKEAEEKSLRDQQEELQKRFNDLSSQQSQNDDWEQNSQKQVENGMKEAQKGFGKKQLEEALGGQKEAIDGLNRLAQSLAQGLERQQNEEPDPDGTSPPTSAKERKNQTYEDPLGRAPPSSKQGKADNKDVIKSQTEAANRASNILQELRRRLGEVERPILERDYLQRLLKVK